jgi:hypothetical protein
MLTNLSVPQVEQALRWLASPVQEPPPQELESISQIEWMMLDRLLQDLQTEQQYSQEH